MTNQTLLRKLRRELTRTNEAFDQHVKKYNCKTDMAGCAIRTAYQERVATLNHAILLAGGRGDDAYLTTIDELQAIHAQHAQG